MRRPANLSIRSGRTNALCKTCGKTIQEDKRVVYTLASEHQPEHHHISCFLRANSTTIVNLYDRLTIRESKNAR